MTEKVSVIIPTHNAEKTIEKCLDSVLQQTYNNLEIILCDDCSSDKTLIVLEKYKNKYQNIIIIKNEKNMRAAYSRNRCIEKSTGEYICQIDDDDYMDSKRIETQVKFLCNNTNIDFVGSNMYYFNENGIWKKSNIKRNPTKYDFLKGTQFLNPSVMFRKDCLTAVNGYRVAKETRRGQDYDLYMRLYANGFVGYNLDDCLTYYYRGKIGYNKTNYLYRVDESIVRFKNFRDLKILIPVGIFFVFKPLIIGLIPFRILEKIKYFCKTI